MVVLLLLVCFLCFVLWFVLCDVPVSLLMTMPCLCVCLGYVCLFDVFFFVWCFVSLCIVLPFCVRACVAVFVV